MVRRHKIFCHSLFILSYINSIGKKKAEICGTYGSEKIKSRARKTILGMIGEVAEYEVRRYALGWFDKGVLLDTDLADIELLLTPAEETDGTETSEPGSQEAMEG